MQMPQQDVGKSHETDGHRIDEGDQQMYNTAPLKDRMDNTHVDNSMINNVQDGKYIGEEQIDGAYQENYTNQGDQMYSDYNSSDQTQSNIMTEHNAQSEYHQNENHLLTSSHNSDSLYPTPRSNDNDVQNGIYPGTNADQGSDSQAPQLFNPGQFQQPVYPSHSYEPNYAQFNTEATEQPGKKFTFIALLHRLDLNKSE